MKTQNGFTMIEIAIIMVILGLLLGAVLKGQEMIFHAKIRRVTNEINSVSALIYNYATYYHALPGDDPDATQRWPEALSGNGDWIISGDWNDIDSVPGAGASGESRKFWDHLRRAELLQGVSGYSPLVHAFKDHIGVAGKDWDGSETLYGMRGNFICLATLSGKAGQILDAQLDDGQRNSGDLRADLDPLLPDIPDGNSYEADSFYSLCRLLQM